LDALRAPAARDLPRVVAHGLDAIGRDAHALHGREARPSRHDVVAVAHDDRRMRRHDERARRLGELQERGCHGTLLPTTRGGERTMTATAVKPINHWISGAPYEGESGRSGAVYNPATGEQTGAVDFASVDEIDAAVQSAKAAFPGWRSTSLAKRAEILFAIRELVHARREDIARILTAEHGKVLSDAMGEVTRGLEVIEFCCGVPHLLKGGMTEQASTGVDVYSIRQPLGVVAGITPFNFPAMVPMWMW